MIRAFGKAALRTPGDAQLEKLIRLYWYTVEFGVVKEGAAVKAWGAGLLSSFGELGRFETEAELVPFELARVVATPYDPTQYQKIFFVAESFTQLADELSGWLERF
jgi:phenylalanine-4-hydroxylase